MKKKRDYSSYNKEYYAKNKEKRKSEIVSRSKKILHEIREYKLKHGCEVCGYNKSPRALTFHHLSDKEHNVSRMCWQGRSPAKIYEEIKKCQLLCFNCHMELHEVDNELVV